ncbi:MAG: hypothetical protein ACRDUX_38830 [Mycobacterium sp.]
MTPVLAPSNDPVLWPAYRFGQLAAIVVAVLFAFAHGAIVAGIGLVIALGVFRILFNVIRGITFPIIEDVSRAITGGQ